MLDVDKHLALVAARQLLPVLTPSAATTVVPATMPQADVRLVRYALAAGAPAAWVAGDEVYGAGPAFLLEAWAIFVVTAVAGSFATFFNSGDST